MNSDKLREISECLNEGLLKLRYNEIELLRKALNKPYENIYDNEAFKRSPYNYTDITIEDLPEDIMEKYSAGYYRNIWKFARTDGSHLRLYGVTTENEMRKNNIVTNPKSLCMTLKWEHLSEEEKAAATVLLSDNARATHLQNMICTMKIPDIKKIYPYLKPIFNHITEVKHTQSDHRHQEWKDVYAECLERYGEKAKL